MTTNKVMCLLTLGFLKTLGFKSFNKWSVKLLNYAMGGEWLIYMEICCCIYFRPVYQISWSTDSRLLLSDSKDSTLKVWDIRTQKLKLDLPGHADEVYDVHWSPEDGEKVASGGKDKSIEIIDGLD